MHLVKRDDPVLRQIAEPVTKFDSELAALAKEMREFLRWRDAIGLAAPQIGVSKRVVICGSMLRRKRVLVNPRIINYFGPALSIEGCLSLPHVTRLRPRYRWVKVAYETVEGEHKEGWGGQLFAYCLQHEVDHLNGILITDSMPRRERVALAAITPTPEEVVAYG